MQPSPDNAHEHNGEELDLQVLTTSLRRRALPILLVSLLVGATAYTLNKRQSPVYEAVSTVVASANDGGGNSVVNTSLVTAPQLPQGAVEQAVHSRGVVSDIINRLHRNTDLSSQQIRRLSASLQADLVSDTWNNLSVEAKTDSQQAGTYSIRVKAGSPVEAEALANESVAALLAWDVGRAQRRIGRARSSLTAQLSALDTQLATSGRSSQDVATLIAARAQVVQNLAQVAVLEQAATGTLDPVAEAIAPNSAVSPKPLRNGLLAGLLSLLLLSGAAILFDLLRRRVYSEQDVSNLGLPLLGKLPQLSRRDLRGGLIEAARSGLLYMGSGFLRVNVLSQLPQNRPRRLVVSSARPGEGKSSVTAALATGIAASGLKVLIVDADLHRPTQPQVWHAFDHPVWHPVPSPHPEHSLPEQVQARAIYAEPAQTLSSALERLDAVQVMAVAENIDLLPAGRPLKDSSSVIGHPRLAEALKRWGEVYDVVLIDTPPLLVLSDALAFAAHTEGLILVIEAGITSASELERAARSVQGVGSRLLGVVLNKQRRGDDHSYGGYGYRYETTAQSAPVAVQTSTPGQRQTQIRN